GGAGDGAAVSVGADATAAAIAQQAAARGQSVRVVRNGSRGMFWLEPLVEVATPQGRVAYGPVDAAAVPALFAADFLRGGAHALPLGPTDEIPDLKRPTRIAVARARRIHPPPPPHP